MGQIEDAIDRARKKGDGKSGPWKFIALGEPPLGILFHYNTPIFRVNLKTGVGEVGANAWGSVSDQSGIRKAAMHLSRVLGIEVKGLLKKEILDARDRARRSGLAFSNPLPKYPVGKSRAYSIDAGHSHIGKGLIYCKEFKDAAPPVLTHSRVKCALCGKTIQSATNPRKVSHSEFKENLLGASYRVKALKFLMANQGWQSFDPSAYGVAEALEAKGLVEIARHKKPANWQVRFLKGNPSRKPLTARSRRSLKNPPAAQIREAAKALVSGRVVTPETARRIVSETLTYGLDHLPGRARDMMKSALSYLPRQNPVPSYAMLLRTKLNQGYSEAEARGMAERELEQANIFLRMPRRNPGHGRRVATGGVTSPRLIYGRASTLSFGPDGKIKQMTSRKTSGPYKGKDFVHEFKPGVKHIGLPRGTKVSTPDGQSFNLKTRTALMVGPKNLWADFAA